MYKTNKMKLCSIKKAQTDFFLVDVEECENKTFLSLMEISLLSEWIRDRKCATWKFDLKNEFRSERGTLANGLSECSQVASQSYQSKSESVGWRT